MSLLTLNSPPIRDGMLYFGDNTLLPQSLPDGILFNCVLAGGGEIPQQLVESGSANVLVLHKDVDPLACYNTLQTAFMEDREVSAVIRRLLSAHLSNHGLQYFVEEAARAMGHPILVVDVNQRYIAYNFGDLDESTSRLALNMTDELNSGTLSEEASRYIRDQGIDLEIARNSGILEHFNEILGTRTLTTAVMINGICVAHVMELEGDKGFTEVDYECLQLLNKFVAQELQKLTLYGHSTGERGSFFLASLLENDHPSEAVTQRRLRELNFHPKQEFHVLVLQTNGEGLDQMKVEMIAAQLRAVLHHSLYTRHRRKFVALLSRDRGSGLSAGTLRLVREIAMLNGLKVGISNPYSLLSETHSAYREARAAVSYGAMQKSAANDDILYWFRDQVPLRMLDLTSKRADLMPLCHPSLLLVREYDERHDTELMDTLFVYLQCGCSALRASKLLSLHKNTMLYRLTRIRSLLSPSVSLESGEDLFLLQLGFRILMFSDNFVPRVALDREELRG